MLRFEGVGYTYGGADGPAAIDVSLEVAPGKRVVLLGRNGSGKSTLARLANGSLAPTSGRVTVDGKAPSPREVGYVRQDPRAQLVSSVAGEDVGFGPRNVGRDEREVGRDVEDALTSCGLAGMAERSVEEMSGGELQRLALAGVVAMRPRHVVLDEVCSQLDQAAREGVRGVVDDLVASGAGVLEITHLVEDVLGADGVVVLSAGRVAWRGTAAEFFGDHKAWGLAGLRAPELWPLATLVQAGFAPTRSSAGHMAQFAREHNLVEPLLNLMSAWANTGSGGACADSAKGLALQDVTVRYVADRPAALDGASLAVAPGSVMLVAGASGSGKSTAALVAAGLLEPDSGRALLGGAPVRPAMVGMAFQNVADQLFCNTVLEDVSYGPLNAGATSSELRTSVELALRALGVPRDVWDRAPFELSGGQMRRVALAGIVATSPRAYVFDEPTAGLDGEGREELRQVIRALAGAGAAVVVVSHDVGEWLPMADTVAVIDSGAVRAVLPRDEALQRRAFFSSAGLRAPLWIELRDALLAKGEALEAGGEAMSHA